MHLHAGQVGENIRHLFQARPVELYVLAGADMGVALVVYPGDMGQLSELVAAEQAVGHGDTQHGCQPLYVQAVLQSQRQEFRLGQLAGEKTLGLAPELGYPLVDDSLVVLVVNVHQ